LELTDQGGEGKERVQGRAHEKDLEGEGEGETTTTTKKKV